MNLSQLLAQYLAITRYEFLMYWRQRAAPVFTLSLIALPIIFALFMRGQVSSDNSALVSQMFQEQYENYALAITSSVQLPTWAAAYVILTIMAPLMMSEIIPKDRQRGVRELLDGLPLTPSTYLNGKLLAAWLVLLTGLAAAMGIVMVSWRLIFGAVHVPTVLSTWLGGGSALIVLNTGLVVLLAAGLSTRKRAFALSTFFSLVCLVLMILSGTSHGNDTPYQWWEIISPARSVFLFHFMYGAFERLSGGMYTTSLDSVLSLWRTVLAGLVELALVWLFARKYVQTR